VLRRAQAIIQKREQNPHHAALHFMVKDFCTQFQEASFQLRDDREAVLDSARACGEVLQWVNLAFCRDFEVVLAAVTSAPEALQWASAEMRGNKEIVLRAVDGAREALRFATENLRVDLEVVMRAAREHKDSCWHTTGESSPAKTTPPAPAPAPVPTHTAEHRPRLLRSRILNLRFASEELRNDREAVLLALKNKYIDALHYAGSVPRSDKEVVLAAVKVDEEALGYASRELQGDREVVIEALKRRPTSIPGTSVLKYATEQLRGDRDFVLEAIQLTAGGALPCATSALLEDKDLLLLACRLDPLLDSRRLSAIKEVWNCWLQKHEDIDAVSVIHSSLAIQGETAPVVKAALLESIPNPGIRDFNVTVLLSGSTFVCPTQEFVEIWGSAPRQEPATINELARTIVKELHKRMPEAKVERRVYLLCDDSDEAVSPWDCKRPLREFFPI